MSGFFIAWLCVLAVVILVWLTRHLEISRARRTQRMLSSRSYGGPPTPAPRVSVLVAAKDEEDNIETCVRTFLGQDYPDFELIVIDDRSDDATPAILRRLRAEHPDALRVVTVSQLREGWFGKNNAMREGVAVATGDWLCFADADCRQTSPSTLSMAMSEAAANDTGFLSVLPVLETKSFWERLIQPVCAAVMIFWYHPDRVNDPKRSSAYANGAFMLLKREVYESLGGHERVRTEVNEDMHLARLAKQNGHRLRVIQNDDLYVTRMYATLGQTWHGWSRIFYGCLGTLRRLLLAMLLLTSFSLLPWISLVAGLIWSTGTDGAAARPWIWVSVLAGLAVLLEQSVMFRFYRLVRAGPVWSLGYVVGASICWFMLANAISKLRGRTGTTWRGTTYRGDQVETVSSTPTPAAGPVDMTTEELGVHAP